MRRFPRILPFLLAAAAAAALDMPSELGFGARADTEKVTAAFVVANDEAERLPLRMFSSCDCLKVRPESLSLKPGERATVSLTLDLRGLYGIVTKTILVKRDVAGGADRILSVRGTVTSAHPPAAAADEGECEWCRKLSEEFKRQAYESWRSQAHVAHYYYSPDCRACTDFLAVEVPRVERALGVRIDMDRQDIREPASLDELDGILARKGLALKALPVLVWGDSILMGEKEIRGGFEAAARKVPDLPRR